MTPDEAIAIVDSKARGRTRYAGQMPFLDEVLVSEIGRLRAAAKVRARSPEDQATIDRLTLERDAAREAFAKVRVLWDDWRRELGIEAAWLDTDLETFVSMMDTAVRDMELGDEEVNT